MITREGPKVIEFNCRFGDPECQAIMPRLEGDLLALLQAAATGQGLPAALAWSPATSVCVVMASAGYPGRYETGLPITGVAAAAARPGINVFHAGTAMASDVLVTAGGRVLGVQALGGDPASAIGRPTTASSASASTAPTSAGTLAITRSDASGERAGDLDPCRGGGSGQAR